MGPDLKEKIKTFPRVPGVYRFYNSSGKIIYIGKAKNLRSRVGSYFAINIDPSTKTYALVNKIKDVDYIEARTEFEALILEAELIKKHRPKYNINLKDDKSYIYIVIRSEKILIDSKTVKIQKVVTARKTDLLRGDEVFGPFPDGQTAKQIIRGLRRIFPYRDCSPGKFGKYHKLGKPCLYGHLGLCTSPCVKPDKNKLSEYRKNINRIKNLLSGQSSKITKELEKNMRNYSKKEDFETAARYRDLLYKFDYITQDFRSPEEYINNPYLVEDMVQRSLKEISRSLPVLDDLPLRIECYDISNISGKDAVGSMVVAINGRIDKSLYRKFKVRLKDTPDDSVMMKEVLQRRLKRELSENAKKHWGLPDLIILDGGKGQLSGVLEVMDELHFHVPIIGIAKKKESLIYKINGRFYEKTFPKDSEGLKLIIKLRDEAHRFAQKYHHQLRIKKISN